MDTGETGHDQLTSLVRESVNVRVGPCESVPSPEDRLVTEQDKAIYCFMPPGEIVGACLEIYCI